MSRETTLWVVLAIMAPLFVAFFVVLGLLFYKVVRFLGRMERKHLDKPAQPDRRQPRSPYSGELRPDRRKE